MSTPYLLSSWQNRKLVVATCSLTNAPTGSHDLMRRRYSLIFFSCSSKPAKESPRLPMPRSAASISVPGLVTATHIGGGGLWVGLGRRGRVGIGQNTTSEEEECCLHHFGRPRTKLTPHILG